MVRLTPAGTVFAGVAVLSVPFAWFAWRNREQIGSRAFGAFFLVLSVAMGSYALGIGTADVGATFALYRLHLLAVTAMSLLWVVVALEVAGRQRWLNRYSLGLLGAIPTVTAILFVLPWTVPYVATVPATAEVGSMAGFGPGVIRLGVGLVALVATLLASGIYVRQFVRTRHINRAKAVAILTAAISPWLNLIFLILGFFTTHDISGPLFLFAGGVLAVTLARFETLDPVPAAHQSVVETMGNGVIVLDPADRIHEVNPSARSMLDIDEASTLRGDHVADWFPEWQQCDAPTDGWTQLSVERDDQRRYLELRVAPFTDHRDNTVGRLAELRDVTERETHERALARFQTIFTTVDDPVYVLDGDGRFELVNGSFVDLVGYSADELRGRPFGAVLASGERVPDPGEPAELVLQTAGGERLPVETVRKPIGTRFEGLDGGSVGSVRDISERRRVESALSRATERYETLVDASPLAIVAIDPAGRVERWNPAAEELFGYEEAAVLGDRLPIVPERDRERAREVSAAVFRGERKTNVNFVLERADGDRFDAAVSMAPIFDDSEIVGAVAVIADISEQRARERTLERQNERLDEFAEVVSHDLRNPLNIADGYVQMARETGDIDALDGVTEAHERMEEIIEDVLSLARDGADIDDPEVVLLSTVVDDAWAMTGGQPVELMRARDLGSVEGDPARLRSLFENLFRNVADHCPPGTTITVGSLDGRAGFYVADDGPGMSVDERESAFDTGYTTAEYGTGIGLATVKTIADAHDWSVHITDSADGGTRFEFETGPFGERRADHDDSVAESD
jgi:PAS domain S-box-containing protein